MMNANMQPQRNNNLTEAGYTESHTTMSNMQPPQNDDLTEAGYMESHTTNANMQPQQNDDVTDVGYLERRRRLLDLIVRPSVASTHHGIVATPASTDLNVSLTADPEASLATARAHTVAASTASHASRGAEAAASLASMTPSARASPYYNDSLRTIRLPEAGQALEERVSSNPGAKLSSFTP
jgi:hypothetical protein